MNTRSSGIFLRTAVPPAELKDESESGNEQKLKSRRTMWGTGAAEANAIGTTA